MWPLVLNLVSKFIPGNLIQLVTGLNIPAIFQGVGKYIGLVFSYIASHWRVSLGILISAMLIGLGYFGYYEHGALLKERAAHQTDINNFKNAQALADAKAEGEKAALKQESQANADEADAKYSALLAEYRANLVRYKAGQSGTSQTEYRIIQPAQSGNRPGTSTELPAATQVDGITISGEDAQICAVNTARLQAVHDWALNPPKDGNEQ